MKDMPDAWESAKLAPVQVTPGQVGLPKPGAAKVGVAQVRASKVDLSQVVEGQVNARHSYAAQIGPGQVKMSAALEEARPPARDGEGPSLDDRDVLRICQAATPGGRGKSA